MLAPLLVSGPVLADADGPDARRVVDVAPDDSLNARMGPGSDYSVIGTFDHDAATSASGHPGMTPRRAPPPPRHD